jgi:hypothetical protein
VRVTDVHVHIQPWWELKPACLAFVKAGHPEDAQRIEAMLHDPAKLLAYMDAQGVHRAGLINYVAPETLGFTEKVNEFVAGYVKGHEDRLLAFGGVHPRAGTPGEARRQVQQMKERGIRAVKLHPPHQLCPANDHVRGNERLRAIYETCQELGMPVMVHTGTSMFPGARNRFGDPMDLDDVCQDFPDLQVVMAHGGRPLWTREAFFLLRRFDNLWVDFSSIPPRRLAEWFPGMFEIRDQVLYGSDWPGPGVKELGDNIRRYREELGMARPFLDLVFQQNAERLFPPEAA